MKKLAVVLVLIIIVLGGGYFAVTNLLPQNDTKESSTQQDVKTLKATVVLNFGEEEKSNTYSLNLEEGKTALEATKNATGGKVTLDNSGLVDSINGVKADSSKKEYWAFYVNGEYAKVGPADYKVRQGDTIEWKIETF